MEKELVSSNDMYAVGESALGKGKSAAEALELCVAGEGVMGRASRSLGLGSMTAFLCRYHNFIRSVAMNFRRLVLDSLFLTCSTTVDWCYGYE